MVDKVAPKSLAEKLIEVRGAVGGYVEKKGRNTTQGYSFASEADITAKIYPEMNSRGIIFYPESRRVIGVLEYTTTKGGKMMMTTTESKWVATDGVERIEVMTIGQGADSGDKGAYKGMAGDKKYAILQLLGIATGDDPEVARIDEEPEEREARDPNAKASQKQIARMFALAASAGINTKTDEGKKKLQALVLRVTSKHSSSQLTMGDMDKMYLVLESGDVEPPPAEEISNDELLAVTGGELVESAA